MSAGDAWLAKRTSKPKKSTDIGERNAAWRNESANYRLDVRIGGSGSGAQTATPAPDYADGLAGGPDYWEVFGVSETLNIRSGPSSNAGIVIRFPSGTVLQNLGCRINEGRRWCQITQPGGDGVTGWAAGQYLRETAAPSYVLGPRANSGTSGAATASAPTDMMPTWCRAEAATRFGLEAERIAATTARPKGRPTLFVRHGP